jgi:hypothetical protein
MTNNAGCRFQENTPSADIFYRVRKHRKYISSEKKYSYLRHDSSVVYNDMNIRRGEKILPIMWWRINTSLMRKIKKNVPEEATTLPQGR